MLTIIVAGPDLTSGIHLMYYLAEDYNFDGSITQEVIHLLKELDCFRFVRENTLLSYSDEEITLDFSVCCQAYSTEFRKVLQIYYMGDQYFPSK